MEGLDATVETKHQWVEYKRTPVEVMVDDGGDPVPFATGETDVMIGCDVCDRPLLGPEVLTEECSGVEGKEVYSAD